MSGIPFYPNTSDTDRTMWKNSTIRTYLNNSFIFQAFSTNEASSILTSTIVNTDSSGGGGDSANGAGTSYNTQDKLYLLSYFDAFNTSSPYNHLLNSDATRQSSPTDYALSHNAFLNTNHTTPIRTGTAFWYIRSASTSYTVYSVSGPGGKAESSPSELLRPLRPAFALSII